MIVMGLLRLNYLFLAPGIIFSNAMEILPGQNLVLTITIAILGVVGMTLGKKSLVTLASGSLLTLLILGKIATDIFKSPPPDTAIFLLEFMAILFLMEASRIVVSFDETSRGLSRKTDEISRQLSQRLLAWAGGQILNQTKLAAAAVGLSLGLIIVGGFTGISINQLFYSATLVLVSVAVLLFLVTHRREPQVEKAR